MKKLICLIAILLLLTAPSCAAYARSAYQQFWEPGTYSVTLTDEEKQRYDEIWEKTLARSEGTLKPLKEIRWKKIWNSIWK